MDIKTFIKNSCSTTSQKSEFIQQLADFVGVSSSTVKSWCNGHRQIPPKRWGKLKAFSKGLITVYRSDMGDSYE